MTARAPGSIDVSPSTFDVLMLSFATIGFLGFVYMMRPETEEEKRDYEQRFGMGRRSR